MISLSYSRISLADIAMKLQLDSPQDAEYIIAKAIRDGVIEASLDHQAGYMQSKVTSCNTYMHTHTHTYIHAHTHITYIYMRTYVHACTHTQYIHNIHTCAIHACTRIHTHLDLETACPTTPTLHGRCLPTQSRDTE